MISYGSVDGVALYCQQWTNVDGKFDDSTTPSQTAVNLFLADVSAVMSTALAKNGFTQQLVETDALDAVNALVNQMTAQLVRFSKNTSNISKTSNKTGIEIVRDQIANWVADQAVGLEQLGAARQISNLDQIGFREYDPQYGKVNPLFQRADFNNDLRAGHNHGRSDPGLPGIGNIDGTGFSQPDGE